MVSIKELYDLQELDLELERKRAEMVKLQGKLGEPQELIEARAALEGDNEALKSLIGERRSLEVELQGLEDKLRTLEKQLYGGSMRSPKELLAREQELASLKHRKGLHEDQVLALMERIDAQQAKVEQATRDLEAGTALWQSEHRRLQEEIQHLQSLVAELLPRREGLAAGVEPALLARYQSLRPAKHGVAVARVERGLCQGCRIAIPSSDLQRARASRDIVLCNSCGRILYAS